MKRFIALTLGFALTAAATLPAAAQDSTEAQIGQQVYQQLSQKGEILQSSPYYAILDPIARRIAAVADPMYQYPFHFILVHESQPNAFSVPGGNVYVTDSMMRFAKNKEELAGVLCHEVSHDIHHDVVNNMRKDQNVGIAAAVLGALTGGSGIANTLINVGAQAQAMNYSRAVETAADRTGSDICATAGYNPYGMVWLFQQFQKADTGGQFEMLSDHPRDDHRISDLENHFAQNPGLFGKYSPNIATATPLDSGGGSRTTALRPTRTHTPANWKFNPR